jgi:hypothetical protein
MIHNKDAAEAADLTVNVDFLTTSDIKQGVLSGTITIPIRSRQQVCGSNPSPTTMAATSMVARP